MKLPTDEEMKQFSADFPGLYKLLKVVVFLFMLICILGLIYFIYTIFA